MNNCSLPIKAPQAKLSRNAQGNQTTTSYAYEGYGQTQRLNGSEPGLDFLWNQELADKTTNLVYLKNRFYHPDLKRFTSRDAMHVDNRYSYANANPILFTDPLGLSPDFHTTANKFMIIGTVILALGAIFSSIPGFGNFSVSGLLGVASGFATMVSGVCLIGAQLTFDRKEYNAMRGFEYAALAFGVLALAGGVVSAAPNIAKALGIESELVNVLTSWPPRAVTAVTTEPETPLVDLAAGGANSGAVETSDMASAGNQYERIPLSHPVRPRPVAQTNAEPNLNTTPQPNYGSNHTYQNIYQRGNRTPFTVTEIHATQYSVRSFGSTVSWRARPQFTSTPKLGDASLQEEGLSHVDPSTPLIEDY